LEDCSLLHRKDSEKNINFTLFFPCKNIKNTPDIRGKNIKNVLNIRSKNINNHIVLLTLDEA